MDQGTVVDLTMRTLELSLKLAMPLLLAGLVVGLIVSVFQAVTQIQEMTLTFVPKIVVIMTALLLLFPFMLSTLSGFTEHLVTRIIHG